MDRTPYLFEDFAPTSKEQWTQQVIKDLKGAAFETLEYTTADGIKVEPFYTPEDIAEPQPLFSHTDWEVCDSIEVFEGETANLYALDYLNKGATGLILQMLGSSVDFEELFKEISIQYIAIQLEIYRYPQEMLSDFNEYLEDKFIDRTSLNLTINFDPLSHLLYAGNWLQDEQTDCGNFRQLVVQNDHTRNLCVNGEIYHNAGASTGYEIGCMLAHANEYLGWLDDDATKANVQLNVATGPDYFMEIAKLRALRKVFALLLQQYGANDQIYIHATSAERNLTIYDHHNNLLRTTTGAMAAVAGGCNSLQVLPFNNPYEQSNDFGERLARNTQLILKSESYFDKVSDVAAGSFFIEKLTEELAQKGWAYFQEIEAAGGLLESLKKNIIQDRIAAFAAAEQQLFDEGKKVLVGTNKYPSGLQKMKDELNTIIIQEPRVGNVIQPLQAIRLAAKMEQARIDAETPKDN